MKSVFSQFFNFSLWIRVLCLFTAAVASVSASAQSPLRRGLHGGATGAEEAAEPVTWHMEVAMASATEGAVTLFADIAPSWHLYGTSTAEGGPIATEFDFSASSGVVFEGEFSPSVEAVAVVDPAFGMELEIWERPVSFTRGFRIDKSAPEDDDAAIVGTVRFMSCDNRHCMPPQSKSFEFRIKN